MNGFWTTLNSHYTHFKVIELEQTDLYLHKFINSDFVPFWGFFFTWLVGSFFFFLRSSEITQLPWTSWGNSQLPSHETKRSKCPEHFQKTHYLQTSSQGLRQKRNQSHVLNLPAFHRQGAASKAVVWQDTFHSANKNAMLIEIMKGP